MTHKQIHKQLYDQPGAEGQVGDKKLIYEKYTYVRHKGRGGGGGS